MAQCHDSIQRSGSVEWDLCVFIYIYMLCTCMDDFSPIYQYIRFVMIEKKKKKLLKMPIYIPYDYSSHEIWVSSTICIDIFWLEKERGHSKYI